MRLRPRYLRTRLTLWYVSVLAALLALAWGGTCALLFWQLRSQLGRLSVQEIETVEGLLYFTPQGDLLVKQDYHNHPQSKEVIDRFLEVRAADGAVLYRNDRLGDRALGGPVFRGEGVGGYSERSARLSDGTRVRLVSRVHVLDGRRLLIRLAHSEEPLYSRLDDLLAASLIVLPLVLLAAWLAGDRLARRALAPIEQMCRRAREITPEKLDTRLPLENADEEIRALGAVFNQTLARLERAFEQLRRFTADASHELRTPLAMVRSVGEVGLQKDGTRAEYRDIIGSMLEEVNRLTALVENLLTLSRADSGRLPLHPARVAALQQVREAAALFEILIEEKSQRVVIEGDESARIEADPVVLRQALVNLMHNAVRYTPCGGSIAVRVRAAGASVAIEIEDDGPGIPPQDQPRVFDRFYRVDQARSSESGGAGLGLSIAKWAVEAHGGALTLESASGKGCRFQMKLPSANGNIKDSRWLAGRSENKG
ncbi:MAG TPA: heavy metal sensor histidine kinase [Bryobacteraceae bacterium]|nr:heavy metal sensor histidine kinase [Bryobacteraceae bacterium]